jgi:hypothetical protein
MSRVSKTAFDTMKGFISFCQANRNEFELRDKALESSRLNLGETNSLE